MSTIQELINKLGEGYTDNENLHGKTQEDTAAILEILGNFSLLSYSQEEQIIPGVLWIDGKQVYQVTLVGTTGTALNTYNATGLSIPGIETMISLVGSVRNTTGSMLPNNHLGLISFDIDATGHLQEQHANANYSNANFNVTVQYTKK